MLFRSYSLIQQINDKIVEIRRVPGNKTGDKRGGDHHVPMAGWRFLFPLLLVSLPLLILLGTENFSIIAHGSYGMSVIKE